ncbi:hypothetical protein PAECIP112173_03292 [Paenibacillus sp. JJ-100]|uniref:hypothetical protein n=1 Tax=Paenibacillus sp. JJ-100 TaxID=2974896 RepID=UPI0022FF647B|nr:hypothetical protein [Paenibacillus sp. JJ-100]CAI6081691.1 hypothetical protein PAECIP112173_03292 [Paenibacillus sp. JJ-100]
MHLNGEKRLLVQPQIRGRQSVLFRFIVMFAVMFSFGMIGSTSAVHGEGIELNVTAQKAWNTVLNKADAQTKRSLQQSYESAGRWKIHNEMWEQKIKQLRGVNSTELRRIRKAISGIDGTKLASLQQSLEQTQARYEPLFTLYSSLNKQLSAAKAFQSKELSSAIRTQTEALKPMVQLAREEIRLKKMDLAEVRKRKTNEMKRLRTMLNGANTVQKQIQTAKKQISLSRKRYSNAFRTLKQALKKGEPAQVLRDVNSLASSAEKWAGVNENIHRLEQNVSAIYAKVSQEISEKSK